MSPVAAPIITRHQRVDHDHGCILAWPPPRIKCARWCCAGLLATLLLPGILVVRAPWTAVPFLSLYFWIAILVVAARPWDARASWAPRSRPSCSAGVLRLLRPDVSRPSGPTLLGASPRPSSTR